MFFLAARYVVDGMMDVDIISALAVHCVCTGQETSGHHDTHGPVFVVVDGKSAVGIIHRLAVRMGSGGHKVFGRQGAVGPPAVVVPGRCLLGINYDMARRYWVVRQCAVGCQQNFGRTVYELVVG